LALNEPVPKAFLAATFAVYVLPLVRPVTTIGDEAPVFVNTAPLEESVTTTM
jgi:hypothetical protein